MSRIIPLYDRSRVTTDWRCPRARFLQYEWKGKGLVKAGTSLELFTGTVIHDALSAIARGFDIDEIASAAFHQMRESILEAGKDDPDSPNFALEQGTLIEGIIRGFYKHIWPRVREAYPRILYIEQEMIYAHDLNGNWAPDNPDLIFMSKPDLVLADNEGGITYFEYKSTKSKKEDWITSWDTAVQLHSTIKAIKASTGNDVSQVVVQGLYKGFESYGKQSSPFCYAYKRNGNPPFTKDEVRYDYKPGFQRSPTWVMEGGVKKWVEDMPEAVLADQFPQTPPIFVNEALVDSFFRQRSLREYEIAVSQIAMKEGKISEKEMLDTYFPQKFESCKPAYGRACEFMRICHGEVEDPLNSGFQFREPHHQLEAEQDHESPLV